MAINQEIGNIFLVNYKFLNLNKEFDKIKNNKKVIVHAFS